MRTQMILENETYRPESNKHFEGAMTQGNGYLNMRASFEEDLEGEIQNEKYWRLPANVTLEKIRNPITKWGVYVPGIYGKHPILGEELVNLPYLMGMNFYCCNEKFDMGKSRYHGYKKELDMRNGVLKRKVIWETKTGELEIEWIRYPSMKRKHCIIQRIVLYPQDDMDITIESFLDGEVTTNGYNHFEKIEMKENDGLEMYIRLDSQQNVGMKTVLKVQEKKTEYSENGKRISEMVSLHLKKCEKTVVEKNGIVVTDIDEDGTGRKLSERIHDEEILLNTEKNEFREHCRIWDKLWEYSDVEIIGDDSLEFHLKFSIYHLLRSANQSSKVAIDAKGYAGEAYFGHYFWDTEMYLLPFYIYTQPQQAKKLVEFRYHTLDGARKNAEKYGYKGARYPWESCVSGEEQCSNWQYADLEIHVTADVIYGLCKYCELTDDKEFLYNDGLEMMVETARYWNTRVEKRYDGYHLTGVMGPDEYLPFTDDNAYTNYMVTYVLKKTLDAINAASKEQREKLGVTQEECNQFKDIIEKLYIPYDKKKHFIWQSADFDKYEEIDFDTFWTDRSKHFGNCISQERNYRCKALKQADTVSLLYLFRNDFPEETKKNCISYYEKITTHDSSLSYIIHSLVYGDIGEKEKSYEYAVKSMKLDWEEKGAAEGIHIANAGGLWQGVICGFGGLDGIDEAGAPRINPRLPEHISEIRYKIYLKGTWYQVCAEKDSVKIEECE